MIQGLSSLLMMPRLEWRIHQSSLMSSLWTSMIHSKAPCYQLYTTEFYETIKSKLNPGGILVTQSGQAGIKQHHLVFSPIHNTIKQVFPKVIPFNQAVYSFMDEWGWQLALTDTATKSPET